MITTHSQTDRMKPLGTSAPDARIRNWVFCPHIGFEEALDSCQVLPKQHATPDHVRERYRTLFRVFCRFILERQISILELDWIVYADSLGTRLRICPP
ncbi:hypothetical protein [Paraburkholderia azotifigens]|uniref:Uncharacterized protein n=1 Tax=Paraburkholderia azotifigens TaxID=2057004 RepID=A0A5C6V4C9_9BURK|nr:hypothetical protein [Paraburkholderia azotifigens]TXC79754.1 hypothetical protein FRZ40_36055 [Paraburkholderia azotifigens]